MVPSAGGLAPELTQPVCPPLPDAPRVAIDARALVAGGFSLRRYTAELVRGLQGLGVYPDGWLAGWHLPSLEADLAGELAALHLQLPVHTAKAPGKLLYGSRGPALWPYWTRLPLPPLLPRGFDLFHAIHWPFPLLRRPRAVLTIHDLIALRHPEWAPPGAVALCRAVAALAPRAAHVIVDSETVRDELLALSPRVKPERVTAVPLGVVAADFSRAVPAETVADVRRRHAVQRPYFLAVSSIEPRKNLTAALRAYDLLCERGYADHDLRIIGERAGPQPGFDALLQRPRAGTVHLTDRVSEDDLVVLLQQAEGFLFLSLAEGFGLPVLEAFAAGCPVVAANVAPVSEVAGEAALVVDPRDPEAIATAMVRLPGAGGLREQLVRRGRERAAQYTWERTARQTLAVYRQVASA